jgi:hypothetical protein
MYVIGILCGDKIKEIQYTFHQVLTGKIFVVPKRKANSTPSTSKDTHISLQVINPKQNSTSA